MLFSLNRHLPVTWALFAFSLAATAADTMVTVTPMATGRTLHNTALLPDGRVLISGGSTLSPDFSGGAGTSSAQIFDPVTSTWSAAASPPYAYMQATTTALPNGKTLIMGCKTYYALGAGWRFQDSTGTVYDPAANTWTLLSTSVTNAKRYDHVATLLRDGRVLAMGGSYAGPSAVIYNPATNTWSNTGSPIFHYDAGNTATLLPDGRVFATGNFERVTEIYNPASGTWTAGPASTAQRRRHTATLLPDGKVLIVGGGTDTNGYYPQSSADLYDPATNTLTATGSMAAARSCHSATLLPNGKVVVMGGMTTGSSVLASVEIYDPATGTWSTSPAALATARKFHSATLLPDGRIAVAAGSNGSGAALASMEIFTPSASPAWATTGGMGAVRSNAIALTLPDGKILVPGGYNGGALNTAETYDPVTGVWSSSGTMLFTHSEGTATLLPNGKVLVAGSSETDDSYRAEVHDPVAGTWTATPTMFVSRIRHTATLLPSGKVLVTGGGLPNASTNTSLYDPATNTWSTTGSLGTGRLWHGGTLLPDGRVLASGGTRSFAWEAYATCEVYSPATGTWSNTGDLNDNRYRHTSTLLPNGKVLVTGGMHMPGYTEIARATAELYDPATGTWTATGSMTTARFDHRAELLPDGRVMIAGGKASTSVALSSVEIYDPATGAWSTAPSMAAARNSHGLALLTTGKLLVAGGTGSNVNTAELYDPGLSFSGTARPQVSTASFSAARVLSLAGTGLTGISSGSSGGNQDSSTAFPLVQLRSLGNAQVMWASPASWSATAFASGTLANFAPGHLLMTVFTNGVPSESKVVMMPQLPEIAVEQPAGSNIADGGSQSFGSVPNGTDAPLTFTIKNTGDSELTVTGVSVTGGNAADFVVTPANMTASVVGGGSTTFSVTFKPTAAGSRTTTLQIFSDDNDEAIFDITLTGAGLNNAPTITDIPDQTIDEDGATSALAFTVGDFETAAASLTVTRASSNTTLVPLANVVLGGGGTSRTVTATPAANQSGTATITVTVNDGTVSTSDTFLVTVNAVNDAPTLNSISNPAPILEDSGQQTVTLAGISTGGGESQTLVVTATSDNTAVIPHPTVSYASPGATGSLSYTPVANASGAATIIVTVNDGQASNNTISRTFFVTVNAVNDNPTLTAISNPTTILEDSALQTVALSGISAGPGESQTLVVTSSSSNTGLIPHPTVAYTSPDSTGSLSYTPVANASGSAIITVTVNDLQASNNTFSRSFTVSVSAVNDAPTISDIENQVTSEDIAIVALPFTIGDIETSATSLTLTRGSTNTTLVPISNIVFGGSGTSRTVTITPAANQSGTAIITIGVSDGSVTTTDTFVLTVNAVNDAPTITPIANQVITYNTLTSALDFTVGDVESAPSALVITCTSSNQALLPDSSIYVGGSGLNRNVTLVPEYNQTGIAAITLTVSDGTDTTGTSFALTVNAPEIVVEQPFGTGMADGGTRGFGSVAIGSTSSLVFYIKNTKVAALTGLTISTDGANAAEFSVTATPVSPVMGPAGNTAFTVRFTPVSGGDKTATLHIANNDPDESPFDIVVTGKGLWQPSNWRQTNFGTTANSGSAADLADPDNDGVPNLLEYAFGTSPNQPGASRLPKPQVSNDSLTFVFDEPPGITGITYSAEWSITLGSSSWTSTGIDHAASNGRHVFTLPVSSMDKAYLRLKVTPQ